VVDAFGVEGDRLAGLELEAGQQLQEVDGGEGSALTLFAQQRGEDLVQSAEGEPLLEVLEVEGHVHEPTGLEPFLQRAGRLVGHPPTGPGAGPELRSTRGRGVWRGGDALCLGRQVGGHPADPGDDQPDRGEERHLILIQGPLLQAPGCRFVGCAQPVMHHLPVVAGLVADARLLGDEVPPGLEEVEEGREASGPQQRSSRDAARDTVQPERQQAELLPGGEMQRDAALLETEDVLQDVDRATLGVEVGRDPLGGDVADDQLVGVDARLASAEEVMQRPGTADQRMLAPGAASLWRAHELPQQGGSLQADGVGRGEQLGADAGDAGSWIRRLARVWRTLHAAILPQGRAISTRTNDRCVIRSQS
jgi:hypothetical protein